MAHNQSDFTPAPLDELISLLSLHPEHVTLIYRVPYRSPGDPPPSNHITEKSHSSIDADAFVAAWMEPHLQLAFHTASSVTSQAHEITQSLGRIMAHY